MFRRKLASYIKYGLVGGVTIGGVAIGAATILAVNTNTDYAIVRLTRTAFTAVDIGRMYQNMLYTKDWDKDSKEYLEVRSQAHQIGAEKLLELCRANKGVYIKVGQHIGALDYLLPNEYVHTMRILHKDAPLNAVEDLYKVIREELKTEPEELFDDFEKEPLGTASLAQVHKAKLKDGTEVAVKVQHFFVRDNIDMDLKWMEFIINTMSKIFPDFEMNWLVDETKRNIIKELNFMEEGRNAERVAKMFCNYKWLKIPKVFWDYSTERVLVMEYVHGGQVNDIEYIDRHKINRRDLCRKIGDLYSHMIFVTGFVHSDPHPGNVLVRKDPDDKEVIVYLLDHGLYAQLTEEFRYHYSKLWLSIINMDREGMKEHSMAIGIPSRLYGLFACIVSGRPWESIMKGITKTKPSAQEKAVFQNELPSFFAYVTQCLEKVDRQALLIFKTNDLIRSIEFALGLQEEMLGFTVMTKCCNKSVYTIEYKNATSVARRQYLNIKYIWTMFKIYIYEMYVSLISNFSLGTL